MAIGQILGLALLMAVLVIGIVFGTQVFAQADTAHNMSGSPYEEEYHSATDIIILGMTIWQFVGLLLALIALIVALVWLVAQVV
jgi:uncharacterized membrane protein